MKKSRSNSKGGAVAPPTGNSPVTAAPARVETEAPKLVAEPKAAKENAQPAKGVAPKAPEKAEPAKVATQKTAAARPNGIATVIEAKIDVGFGNHLFIRGGGAGLSWGEGTALDCEDPSTWIWKASNVSEPFEFKLLINDQDWCIGANYTVQPGSTMQVIPHFP